MKIKLILLLNIFIIIAIQGISYSQPPNQFLKASNSKKIELSEETKHILLNTLVIGGGYLLSDKPNLLGGIILVGGGLNTKSSKDSTIIGLTSLYNFTLAHQANSKEEVFLTNLAIWGAVELFYPKPKEELKDKKNQATSFKVMPMLGKDNFGLACSYKF
ncbi:MAG: hypothetical protein GY730_11320 [bacterium]|nr:hypothetical protein [bacterium]